MKLTSWGHRADWSLKEGLGIYYMRRACMGPYAAHTKQAGSDNEMFIAAWNIAGGRVGNPKREYLI